MKKLLLTIILALMVTPAWSAIQWRNGTAETVLDGTTAANLIGYNSYNKVVQPLDNLLSTYCTEYLQYNSVSIINVKAGSCVVSNSGGSIRMFMLDSADTTLSATNLDTGSSFANGTTYYVYATSPNATTQASTYYISASNSAPSGQTYYRRLGNFTTDSSGNIIQSSISNDGGRSAQASYDSGWFSVSAGTAYTKTHNLGTTKLLIKIYFSPDGGTTIHEMMVHYSSDGPAYGGMIRAITTSFFVVNTFSNGVAAIWTNGSLADSSSGYYRVIAVPLQ